MKQRDKIALQRYQETLKKVREIGLVNVNESQGDKKARIELLKKDFKAFVKYYFPHYADYETPQFHVDFANMVAKDKDFKGGAEWGRGLAKSVICNVVLPMWLWVRGEPVYLVIVTTNSKRAEALLSDIQAEFEVNPRIIADFGDQKVLGSWNDGKFITKGNFIGQALGVGQSVRGLRVRALRPTLCIVDDLETKELIKNPIRQHEYANWIESDLIPTMDGTYKRFIQANNRFAPRMVQTILQERHPKWKYHHIKAYDLATYEPAWPSKYPKDYYRKLENAETGIGVMACRSEYGQEPHVEGKVFTDDLFIYDKLPRIDHFDAIIGWWDVAYSGTATSDYNAIRVWGKKDNRFYLIDCFVKQCKMKAAIEWIALFQSNLPDSVRVQFKFESQFWNDALFGEIVAVEQQYGFTLNLVKGERSSVKKLDRIMSLHPYYQAKRMVFNEKLKNTNDFNVGLNQLKGIEPGYSGKDDAPDADDYAIRELASRQAEKTHTKQLFTIEK
jgi:phage terminase large subunit-like protein